MNLFDLFSYDPNYPFDIREVSTRPTDGALVKNLTYATPFSRRRAAYLVRPEEGEGQFPVILYVHWYEPESPDSNRTQFLQEAIRMAKRGVVSLLVETLWSDRDWFLKRTQEDDWGEAIEQVVELRQAMDILLAEPGIDPSRFAYVGHDFGAMYGVVMGAADPRPSCYTLMAGTPRFPDWFLYYPRLEGKGREDFIEKMSVIDPICHVDKLAPAPVLFQFGDNDPHVRQERGEEFFQAAIEPKEVLWYQAGHGLNEKAQKDRIDWVSKQLGLG